MLFGGVISWNRSILIKNIVYFAEMIRKQGNKPKNDNLWRHPYVILHFGNIC